MTLIRTEQFQAAVAEWVRRHGIDPATIPAAAKFQHNPGTGTWSVVNAAGERIDFEEREPFPTDLPPESA